MQSSTRERFGWYVYDWANSAFYTTVVTTLFGPYVTQLAIAGADADHNLNLFGFKLYADSLWSLLIAVSVVLQVLLLPLVGAVADATPNKKRLLGFLAYVGAGSSTAMYFLDGAEWQWGVVLFILANLGFGGSVVVYNSFLNDLAPPEERDAVSSKGWAFGYLGGGLLLLANLLLLQNAEKLGLTVGQAVRICLATAGLWWGLFTVVPLLTLRNRPRPPRAHARLLTSGFRQLGHTLRDLRLYPQALLFLLAYLLYNDAVQAVISLSGQFASRELNMGMAELTPVILAVQFVAFFGALLFGYVARVAGAKNSLLIQLVIWTVLVLLVNFWVRTPAHFWVVGVSVGVVLGGTQALSRSLFSVMIPKNREAEYFGLYEVADRGTSWLAPAMFAVALNVTHSYRTAIGTLIVFFIAGLAVLVRVNVQKGMQDAA